MGRCCHTGTREKRNRSGDLSRLSMGWFWLEGRGFLMDSGFDKMDIVDVIF